ncbi:MAG: cation:proton antiporter regulatory subunit [Candidatus Microthrix sp.]|nr:cation:proton antiporter regulatory subunit [Candidatus Microthrix sp.]MBK6437041.1 cation:proton antiporter regulatory subunit [Candidatus Microthrix sp.]
MGRVTESELPGVGARFDLTTDNGDQLGVVVHRSGRRDVAIYDKDDPDACRAQVHLEEHEARDLAELLGGSRLSEEAARLRTQVAGITLDWLTVEPGAPWAGITVGAADVRSVTGVSIVAIIRNGEPSPSPGPEDHFEVGDTVFAIGMPDGLEVLAARLSS